jgi:ATP-dependent Lhr-like helicase
MQVAYLTGGRIGAIEESFVARLRPGDCFVFAGRVLEYVRTRDMTAYVTKTDKKRAAIPVWSGGRMPLSSELADAALALLGEVAHGDCLFDEPEIAAARPMLAAQARLSRLPTPGTLLVEQLTSREGHHVMLYPFAGRSVHMGLASLLAWRLARGAPNTFSLSVNDLGLELLSALPVDISSLLDKRALSPARLLADLLQSLNAGELAQRRFREIARVAGLVTTGYPGAPRSTRQLQASSALFFEVFRQHDAGNRLLAQAEREALAQELDLPLLAATCRRLQRLSVEHVQLAVPSPFALPLMVERFREQLTTEKLGERLQRMLAQLEAAVDGEV